MKPFSNTPIPSAIATIASSSGRRRAEPEQGTLPHGEAALRSLRAFRKSPEAIEQEERSGEFFDDELTRRHRIHSKVSEYAFGSGADYTSPPAFLAAEVSMLVAAVGRYVHSQTEHLKRLASDFVIADDALNVAQAEQNSLAERVSSQRPAAEAIRAELPGPAFFVLLVLVAAVCVGAETVLYQALIQLMFQDDEWKVWLGSLVCAGLTTLAGAAIAHLIAPHLHDLSARAQRWLAFSFAFALIALVCATLMLSLTPREKALGVALCVKDSHFCPGSSTKQNTPSGGGFANAPGTAKKPTAEAQTSSSGQSRSEQTKVDGGFTVPLGLLGFLSLFGLEVVRRRNEPDRKLVSSFDALEDQERAGAVHVHDLSAQRQRAEAARTTGYNNVAIEVGRMADRHDAAMLDGAGYLQGLTEGHGLEPRPLPIPERPSVETLMHATLVPPWFLRAEYLRGDEDVAAVAGAGGGRSEDGVGTSNGDAIWEPSGTNSGSEGAPRGTDDSARPAGGRPVAEPSTPSPEPTLPDMTAMDDAFASGDAFDFGIDFTDLN